MSQDGGGAITKGNDTVYNKITTGQTSCTNAATLIVAGSGYRAKLYLFNVSTDTPIYVGPTTSVTTTNGFGLEPRKHICWPYTGALYGIVTTGSEDVSVAEIQT